MDDRLYRSPDDRMLTGVAGGVAERLDTDPSIIRIVWAVLIFLTGGLALLVYIVMAIVVPERPSDVPIRTTATAADGANTGDPASVPAGRWLAPDGSSVPLATASAPRPRPRRDPADGRRVGFVGGLVLIGIGAVFLLRELIPAFDFDLLWPALLIGLGIVLLVAALAPNRRSG